MPQHKYSDNTVIKLDASQYFDSIHLADASIIDQIKRVAQTQILDFTPHPIVDQDEGQRSLTVALVKAHDAVKELQFQLQNQPEDLALELELDHQLAPDHDRVADGDVSALDHFTRLDVPSALGSVDGSELSSRRRNWRSLTTALALLVVGMPIAYGGYTVCTTQTRCQVPPLMPMPRIGIGWLPSAPAPVIPRAASSAVPSLPDFEVATTVSLTPPPALFRDAVNGATQAAEQAQTAQQPEDWAVVAKGWRQALGAMQAVAPTDAHYAVAQTKIYEYTRNLTYAQHNALNANQHLEFRQAVLAATQAAELTQTAQQPAEWQAVVTSWQQAIAAMQAIRPTSTYAAIATEKAIEYSRNLGYAQGNLQLQSE